MSQQPATNDRVRAFLVALADLMEKHGVSEIEVREDDGYWHPYCTGFDFEFEGKWDDDLNQVWAYATVGCGRYEDSESIRKLADDHVSQEVRP